jgi:hypothetical protein
MTVNPYQRIAGLISDMIGAESGKEPVVLGRPMSRATTCDLITALKDEAITLGMHKTQYPWDDKRVVEQVAKVQEMVEHLRERFECA